jgi:peptide subunit release factor 1 (eRF1)
MVTKADLASLSAYETTTGHVLSVYLDVDQSKPGNLNRGFECVLENELRTKAGTLSDTTELWEFELIAAKMRDFVSKFVPTCRGVVLYSKSDESLWVRELDVPTQTAIYWGKTAYVEPLVKAIDDYERYGVVLVDRLHGKLYTVVLGRVEKYAEVQALGWVRRIKSAGKDHLYSQSSFQRRADEHVHSHLKRVVELLEDLVHSTPFERLVLAGNAEITSALYGILPKWLRTRVVGSVTLSANASDLELLAAVEELERTAERSYEVGRVQQLLDAAGGNHKATVDVAATLRAINEKRVHELLYSETGPVQGAVCEQCGALYESGGGNCEYCNVRVVSVEDLTDLAITRTLAAGGRIEHVRGEAAKELGVAGGFGAFLRY